MFPERLGPAPLTRLCEHVGWEIVPPAAAGGRWHARLDSLLIWGLIWAFQPAGLRGRGVAHGRIEVWMSSAKLTGRYGSRGGDGRAGPDHHPAVLEQH